MKPIWKQASLLLAAASLLIVSACGGGGGDSASVAPPPAASAKTSMTHGPVLGFGSVIVNGIRFDDSTAKIEVEDEDDDKGGLKLGMVVRVEGKINDDGVTGKADRIEMGAEVRGPVESVDAAAKSFVAMGASVKVNDATLFERVLPDLSDLKAGDIVQVHGLPDATGLITATRMQKRPPQANAVFKTVGAVAATPVPTATSFKLGTLTVNYTDTGSVLRDLPNPIPAGTLVRVKTRTAPAGGVIAATQIRPLVATPQGDASEAEVKGFVTGKNGDDFKVAGIAVKVSATTTYLRGTAADLKDGALVEVEGAVTAGVIQARKVKFEDRDGAEVEFEFKGAITDYVSISDFKVKGQKIDASKAELRLRAGASALANGMNVEVKGRSMNGDVLIATRVKQED
ncbi:MAG: DUF5666 domain-containing protein [Burkholderiaceae bacterium]